MIDEKMNRVKMHELSHLLMHLYVGGSPESVCDIQLKPNSGCVTLQSYTIAEHCFAHACVALAGPAADKVLGIKNYDNPKTLDMNNFMHRMGRWVSRNDSSGSMQSEIEKAWNATECFLVAQWSFLQELAIRCDPLMNGNNVITRTKAQKLARFIIDTMNKRGIHRYQSPEAFYNAT